jgi:Type II CAAX prenyl endopeptidase Rce1-like
MTDAGTGAGEQQPAGPPPWAPARGLPPGALRQWLVLETWFLQLAFLLPAVLIAVDDFARHLRGVGTISHFPTIVPNPVENLILGSASYLAVAAIVPLALLLLSRTGQTPATLGLTTLHWGDALPALGIAAASYGIAVVISVPLAQLTRHSRFFAQSAVPHVPTYYVLYGLIAAAVTAVAEETMVNGYLLTRLEQLGWTPDKALLLSIVLRTSYHVYYGIGFLVTIPLGYFAGRSFQKHHRLTRPVLAHFLYDAVLLTIAVLAR